MGKKVIYYNRSSDILDMLQFKNVPHTVELTRSTMTIDTSTNKYMISNKFLKYKELNFIRKVKKDGEKLNKPKVNVSSSDINYFKFNNINAGRFNDIVEIDVNKAYWILAYRLGYISKDVYQKGLTLKNKMTRLIALGSLATNKKSYRFENGEYSYISTTCNERTRSYFMNVSNELDFTMMEVKESLLDEDFYFYWVDAFFVRKRAAAKVIEIFKQHGLECKTIDCMYLNVVQEQASKKAYLCQIKNRNKNRTDFKIKTFSFFNKEDRFQYYEGKLNSVFS